MLLLLKSRTLGTGTTAQSELFSPCKHQELSSSPAPLQDVGTAVPICTHQALDRRQVNSCSPLTCQAGWIGKQAVIEGDTRRLTSGIHRCAHTECSPLHSSRCAHTNTHTLSLACTDNILISQDGILILKPKGFSRTVKKFKAPQLPLQRFLGDYDDAKKEKGIQF